MKKIPLLWAVFLFLPCLALSTFGTSILAKPEEWAAEQKRGEEFLKQLGGDTRLTEFLRVQIDTIKVHEGLRLDGRCLGAKWKVRCFDQYFRLCNGKWFVKSLGGEVQFWQCEGRDDSRAVCIRCRLVDGKLVFESVGIAQEPLYLM